MPTVRYWLLSRCSVEWKSTKLPVTARSRRVTALCLVMLPGGGEEAKREVWVLKVPHIAGPLLHWLPWGMLPILQCFLSTLREPDRGT